MHAPIFLPMMAMVLLTIAVWLVMYVRRIGYLNAHNIDAQQLASPEKVNALLPEAVNNPANNFKNLFEVPVLFYVVCLVAFLVQQVDAFYVYGAWAYVALRALHSVIQCTTNTVMHRFAVYALSCLVLWVMAARLFFSLI